MLTKRGFGFSVSLIGTILCVGTLTINNSLACDNPPCNGEGPVPKPTPTPKPGTTGQQNGETCSDIMGEAKCENLPKDSAVFNMCCPGGDINALNVKPKPKKEDKNSYNKMRACVDAVKPVNKDGDCNDRYGRTGYVACKGNVVYRDFNNGVTVFTSSGPLSFKYPGSYVTPAVFEISVPNSDPAATYYVTLQDDGQNHTDGKAHNLTLVSTVKPSGKKIQKLSGTEESATRNNAPFSIYLKKNLPGALDTLVAEYEDKVEETKKFYEPGKNVSEICPEGKGSCFSPNSKKGKAKAEKLKKEELAALKKEYLDKVGACDDLDSVNIPVDYAKYRLNPDKKVGDGRFENYLACYDSLNGLSDSSAPGNEFYDGKDLMVFGQGAVTGQGNVDGFYHVSKFGEPCFQPLSNAEQKDRMEKMGPTPDTLANCGKVDCTKRDPDEGNRKNVKDDGQESAWEKTRRACCSADSASKKPKEPYSPPQFDPEKCFEVTGNTDAEKLIMKTFNDRIATVASKRKDMDAKYQSWIKNPESKKKTNRGITKQLKDAASCDKALGALDSCLTSFKGIKASRSDKSYLWIQAVAQNGLAAERNKFPPNGADSGCSASAGGTKKNAGDAGKVVQ